MQQQRCRQRTEWAVKAPNGQAAARLTTRNYQQELHGHDFFFPGTRSITHMKSQLVASGEAGPCGRNL